MDGVATDTGEFAEDLVVISPEPSALFPVLVANVITGAAFTVVDAFELTAVDRLGAVGAGTTTGVIVLAVVCGLIAVQGGPPGQPVITN